MKSLDLTGTKPLSNEAIVLLNEIVREVRGDYNKLIDEASREFGHDIDWWVTPLATRNIFSSNIFEQCCYIRLVHRLLNRTDNSIHSIIVDSRPFAKVIRQLLKKNKVTCIVEVRKTFQQRLSVFLPIKNLLAAMFHSLSQLYCAHRTADKRLFPTEGIVLIDTFLYANSFKNGVCFDRHYPDLEKGLSPNEMRNIFYLPTFYKVKKYFHLFDSLRLSERQFLVKEDYLKASDYMFAFLHGFRTLKFAKHNFKFDGLDLIALIKNELYRNFSFSSSIDALLKFRLAQRMKEEKIEILSLIDWFENQDIDRGLNAGFRKNYPETEVVGYQGYVIPDLYMCAYPTEEEYQSKVIPMRIAVPGRGWVNLVKEFCPNLEISIAPAFRFQGVWEKNEPVSRSEIKTILVALPIYMDKAINILDIISALDGVEKTCVQVKAHPATSVKEIVSKLSCQLPESICFVTEPFDELIKKSELLISGASSVCLETIARGIPVIVVGNQNGITLNSIPNSVPENIWKLCYSQEDVLKAVDFFLKVDREEFKNIGEWVKREYFNPVSSAGVRKFLGNESG